jgi:MFS family permease
VLAAPAAAAAVLLAGGAAGPQPSRASSSAVQPIARPILTPLLAFATLAERMAPTASPTTTSPLTPAQERRFVRCQRLITVCQFPGWIFTLAYVADTRHYLRLCGGDIGTMAVSRGTTEACIALASGLLAPIFGSLSDAIGRRPLQLFAGSGALLRCILVPLTTSLRARIAADILCKGVVESALKTVKGATHADVFATRPERSGEVRAAEDMWMGLAAIFSPSVGELLSRAFGDGATWIAAGGAAVLSMGATLACPETLPPRGRRRFQGFLRRANPVSGVWVLLSHGRRLRQLTVASLLRAVGLNLNIVLLESYRLGVLRWTPVDLSRYKQSVSWLHGLVQGVTIPRILRRLGNRRSGEVAAVSRAFPSWNRSILTEICLCPACSCQEILRVETPWTGGAQRGDLRLGQHLPPFQQPCLWVDALPRGVHAGAVSWSQHVGEHHQVLDPGQHHRGGRPGHLIG